MMRTVLAGWIFLFAALSLGADQRLLPGRLVAEYGPLIIEHSPGQEPYAEALARALPGWLEQLKALRERQNARPPSALSARDLRENRDAILGELAGWSGLDVPTEQQSRAYDVFLQCYESQAAPARAAAALWWELADSIHVAIWSQAELSQRLRRGEMIPDFHYDPATGQVRWEVAFESAPGRPEDQSDCVAAERLRLDHPTNYVVEDGVARLALPWTEDSERAPAAGPAEALRAAVEGLQMLLPMMIDDAAGRLTPAQAVERHLNTRDSFARSAVNQERIRNPDMARLIIHETTEIGLVERYIGSPDRRWLCEGMANFVALAVARSRGDEALAKQVFDLEGQLVALQAWQAAVDLLHWPAAEQAAASDGNEYAAGLQAARQAFATRAVLLMVRRHGDAFLPALWQEIGQTPRPEVTMATVAEAYAGVTGGQLADVLHTAQTAPIRALLAFAPARR